MGSTFVLKKSRTPPRCRIKFEIDALDHLNIVFSADFIKLMTKTLLRGTLIEVTW